MTTRRHMLGGMGGIAAILASGKAPAAIVRSMLGARSAIMGGQKVPYDARVEYVEGGGGVSGPYIRLPDITLDPFSFGTRVKACLYNDISGTVTIAGCWGPAFSNAGYCFSVGGNYLSRFFSANKNWRGGNENGTAARANVGEISEVSIVNQGDWDGSSMTMRIRSPLVNEDMIFDNPYPTTVISDFGVFGIISQSVHGNLSEIPHARIYRFQLLRYSIPFVDLIPVRFTNELGQTEYAMYDRANPTAGVNPDGSARDDGLYRNRGYYAFTGGPDMMGGGGQT